MSRVGAEDGDGGAFTDFLAKPNAGAGFAGHTDWRLPTSAGCCGLPTGQPAELESIVELGHGAPTINPIFGPTASDLYWSSLATSNNASFAWYRSLSNGQVLNTNKTTNTYVRAVRGGP